jgi:hypothetical protein
MTSGDTKGEQVRRKNLKNQQKYGRATTHLVLSSLDEHLVGQTLHHGAHVDEVVIISINFSSARGASGVWDGMHECGGGKSLSKSLAETQLVRTNKAQGTGRPTSSRGLKRRLQTNNLIRVEDRLVLLGVSLERDE